MNRQAVMVAILAPGTQRIQIVSDSMANLMILMNLKGWPTGD